jgi:hypothetical protein
MGPRIRVTAEDGRIFEQRAYRTRCSTPFWKKRPAANNTLCISQNLKHMNMEMRVIKSPKSTKVKFAVWHGGRKHVAQLRTAKAAVSNMIKGLTVGWQYKMRAVYAHFPINVIIAGDAQSVEIR